MPSRSRTRTSTALPRWSGEIGRGLSPWKGDVQPGALAWGCKRFRVRLGRALPWHGRGCGFESHLSVELDVRFFLRRKTQSVGGRHAGFPLAPFVSATPALRMHMKRLVRRSSCSSGRSISQVSFSAPESSSSAIWACPYPTGGVWLCRVSPLRLTLFAKPDFSSPNGLYKNCSRSELRGGGSRVGGARVCARAGGGATPPLEAVPRFYPALLENRFLEGHERDVSTSPCTADTATADVWRPAACTGHPCPVPPLRETRAESEFPERGTGESASLRAGRCGRPEAGVDNSPLFRSKKEKSHKSLIYMNTNRQL